MKKHVAISVEPTLVDYLAARIQSDEEFLAERQNALHAEKKEINAAWQYLQGKRDMCKQFLLYLEEIQRSPRVVIEPPPSKIPVREIRESTQLFRYPDDYDTNE